MEAVSGRLKGAEHENEWPSPTAENMMHTEIPRIGVRAKKTRRETSVSALNFTLETIVVASAASSACLSLWFGIFKPRIHASFWRLVVPRVDRMSRQRRQQQRQDDEDEEQHCVLFVAVFGSIELRGVADAAAAAATTRACVFVCLFRIM